MRTVLIGTLFYGALLVVVAQAAQQFYVQLFAPITQALEQVNRSVR